MKPCPFLDSSLFDEEDSCFGDEPLSFLRNRHPRRGGGPPLPPLLLPPPSPSSQAQWRGGRVQVARMVEGVGWGGGQG